MPWGAAVFIARGSPGCASAAPASGPFLAGGLLLAAVGAAWLALTARPRLGYWQLLVPLILTGLGFSTAIAAAHSSVLSHIGHSTSARHPAPSPRCATSAARSRFALAVGRVRRVRVVRLRQVFRDGFRPALGVCAAPALDGAVAGLLARPTRHRPAGRTDRRPASEQQLHARAQVG